MNPILSPKKILVIRPDRIGDVVLSTPVLEALKRAYPQAQVDFLVRSPVHALIQGHPHVDKAIVYDPNGKHRGWKGVLALATELRLAHYDVAITLQAQFAVSLAVCLAGIPERIGPRSKLFSFLLFNRGIRQRRSQVEMHEAEYNLELVKALGVNVNGAFIAPKIALDSAAVSKMRGFIAQSGLREGMFTVVHPGMGGSAANWSQENYAALATKLVKEGKPVLLSGTGAEKPLLDAILSKVQRDTGKIIPVYLGALTEASLKELAALYSLARVVVAPSTGPLHIAVALDRATVSFYPAIEVQSAKRWGPYSASQNRHFVLHPVENIEVDDAFARILQVWEV